MLQAINLLQFWNEYIPSLVEYSNPFCNMLEYIMSVNVIAFLFTLYT